MCTFILSIRYKKGCHKMNKNGLKVVKSDNKKDQELKEKKNH